MNSMTGFGRAEGALGTSQYSIEIKSVNHRYLDARFRLPPALAAFEIPLAELLRSKCERGSFEIYVKQRPLAGTESGTASGTRMTIDTIAAETFMKSCEWLGQKYQLNAKPSLEAMVHTNRIFVAVEEATDTSLLLDGFKQLFQAALNGVISMRSSEGKKLRTILDDGIDQLAKLTEQLAKLAPEQPKRIQEKLKGRLEQLQMTNVDAQRLEWEVAFYADRCEISEELDRLRAHTKEFKHLLGSAKAIGRKLDFMTQELHREINTMGAKAATIEITQLTVEAKTTIEKLREQVQNVE